MAKSKALSQNAALARRSEIATQAEHSKTPSGGQEEVKKRKRKQKHEEPVTTLDTGALYPGAPSSGKKSKKKRKRWD
jgi:hypothetical protein